MFIIKKLEYNEHSIAQLKKLLSAYGEYMYNTLKLIAGKETFYEDLKSIPGIKYSPPLGIWLLGFEENNLAGCVAIKQFQDNKCEMKRMFIKPEYRGRGLGKLFCNAVIEKAIEFGYDTVLLDTIEEMIEAVSLYKTYGFYEIPAYCINENDHPVYMAYHIH